MKDISRMFDEAVRGAVRATIQEMVKSGEMGQIVLHSLVEASVLRSNPPAPKSKGVSKQVHAPRAVASKVRKGKTVVRVGQEWRARSCRKEIAGRTIRVAKIQDDKVVPEIVATGGRRRPHRKVIKVSTLEANYELVR